MPGKSRQSKRQDQRKLVTFQIKNCAESIVRRNPSPEEIDAFFVNITNNQRANFGVERLSTINLNVIASVQPTTLLEYAIDLGRDAIISSLFKAGVNIFFRSCHCSNCLSLHTWHESGLSNRVLARLKARHFENIVWTLRVARALTSTNHDVLLCSNPSCEQNIIPTYSLDSPPQCCLLKFPECGHHVCEICFWNNFARLGLTDDLCCATCNRALTDYSFSGVHMTHSRRKLGQKNGSLGESVTTTLTKEQSKALWEQLPEQRGTRVVDEGSGSSSADDKKSYKHPFCAMSLNQLASVFIGEV